MALRGQLKRHFCGIDGRKKAIEINQFAGVPVWNYGVGDMITTVQKLHMCLLPYRLYLIYINSRQHVAKSCVAVETLYSQSVELTWAFKGILYKLLCSIAVLVLEAKINAFVIIYCEKMLCRQLIYSWTTITTCGKDLPNEQFF